MLDVCEYYSIEDTIKFQTIVVADALRENSLPRNAAEFLDLDAMQDYYGIGRSTLTLCRERQRDQEPLFPEFHRKPFLSKDSKAGLMKDFEDTLETKSKASMEEMHN